MNETPFQSFHRGLVHAHADLRGRLSAILSRVELSETTASDRAIASFCSELENHHHAEAAFIFPAFRAAGRLRSYDVAFLDARDAEHVDIQRLCLEMRDASRAHRREALSTKAWRVSILKLGGELQYLSLPHFAIEESTLTAARVAEMMTARELAAMHRDMGQHWNDR